GKACAKARVTQSRRWLVLGAGFPSETLVRWSAGGLAVCDWLLDTRDSIPVHVEPPITGPVRQGLKARQRREKSFASRELVFLRKGRSSLVKGRAMSADRRWSIPLFNRIRTHEELVFCVERVTCLTATLLTLWPLTGRAQNITATINIAVGSTPAALAVNPVTNKVYVASGPITVIDGATNAIASVNSDGFPVAVAVNPVTNKIYFADKASNPGRVI